LLVKMYRVHELIHTTFLQRTEMVSITSVRLYIICTNHISSSVHHMYQFLRRQYELIDGIGST
jgi:hypothetical protein